MQVSDLRHYLTSLATLLQQCRAKSVHNDVQRVVHGLQPFDQLTVAQLADFLERAEEYDRTGVIPAQSKKSSRRVASVDTEAVAAMAQATLTLLERVIDESVTYKDIDAHVKQIGKLKATEVRQVAKEVGIPGAFKTKGKALNAIEELLSSKKQTAIITSRI